MLRSSRLLLLALPFEPMALSTLDALESKLAKNPPSALKREAAAVPPVKDTYYWFDPAFTGAPFFISPKHDGVRMVSYVSPKAATPAAPLSKAHKNKKEKSAGRRGRTNLSDTLGKDPLSSLVATGTTTYSRHGRALYGMFWIEKELALLRALCMDPLLVLDGELYIHRPSKPAAAEQPELDVERASAARTKTDGKVSSRSRNAGLTTTTSDSAAAGDSFKTGFLAVSALCHRLRGTKSQCATVKDILQYVATLPQYCLFDVPAYSPPASTVANVLARYPKPVAAELRDIWDSTMRSVGLTDAEALRCMPNVTPFSQRLRTLHFLVELLSRGCASPMLQAAFGVGQPEEMAPLPLSASASSVAGRGGKGGRQKTGGADRVVGARTPSSYKGGIFVKMIPYEVTHSLEDAKTRLLPLYEQQGYEGAVIRSPTNAYAMREKRKGVVASLVTSMHALPVQRLEGRDNGANGRVRWRITAKDLLAAASGGKDVGGKGGYPIIHTSISGGARGATERGHAKSFLCPLPEDDSDAVAQLAVANARHLPRRSETAVKLLPFKDKEYLVLRPLLKEPSRNPRTRPLLAVPLSTVSPNGDRSFIKPDPATSQGSGKVSNTAGTTASSRKVGAKGNEEMVVFYGLQCLAENGTVFNVTMPKLTPAQQRELLEHLLSAGRQRKSFAKSTKGRRGAGRADNSASLTGTYVTVKFSSLTEHGVPRFGQVKAIRGGKGWQM